MRKPDSEYFAERLSAERDAAARAKSEAARAAHEKLADHYESRLNGDEPESRSDAPKL
jgi:hypothetical protein